MLICSICCCCKRYLLECTSTKEVAVIDPVDADKVIAKVNELGLKLTKVLTTHHHYDHAGWLTFKN